MRTRVLCAGFVLVLAAVGASAAEPARDEALRATMHEVFEVLAQLLPASLDDERFTRPEERERIDGWLRALAVAANDVERHIGARDPGAAQISRSLRRDVAEARTRFALGHYPEARFYVAQLTENCVACHSRLPKARDFPLAQKLTNSPQVAALEPRERARLLIATRQFDAALAAFETRLADRGLAPAELDLDGELLSYLVVAVRVERDFARARRALTGCAARPDVPRYLALELRAWTAQLDELAPSAEAEPTLALARKQIAAGRALSEFPADRVSLIYDLSASSLLHRLIARGRAGREERAEAYFLLGAIEARIDRGPWVSETEQHLESSIRTSPNGPFAQKAYALLEEYTVETFGGAAGEAVPPEVEARLEELRQLVDAQLLGSPPP